MMQIHSLNLKAKTTDQMINQLKERFPADSLDRLRQQLNISDITLSKIVQIPKRTLDRRRMKVTAWRIANKKYVATAF